MTDLSENSSKIEGMSIKDIGNLSIVELLMLQKLLRHGKPVVRHILFNELSHFLLVEQTKVAKSIDFEKLPAVAQKFQKFLKSKKKFSSSSFYYSLDNLESKGLVKFNYDENDKVESVEATKFTEVLNETVLKHLINFGLLEPVQHQSMPNIIKEVIKLEESTKFDTLLFIWFKNSIDIGFINSFTTLTNNLFILSKKKTFETATKFGLKDIQYSALFNDTIRESDNFFDCTIIPYYHKNPDLNGIKKDVVLKEAIRITKENGIVLAYGFVPFSNVDHGILNIFINWVENIYNEIDFYTEEEFKRELIDAGVKTAKILVYKGYLFGIGKK
ncbi:MAG: hypothetical protein ACFFBI_09575 [Promethearchaeota archaeon]